ncbi:hypothetical protein [uncultured Ruegeria sp.]|uniref:hypothetical protein n=1 Tax=uncultured Ruegeria sp. TaxID=259304 RepID=UPI00262677F3|nr:hypothetical protein [uncultured Ruegeria sp.]
MNLQGQELISKATYVSNRSLLALALALSFAGKAVALPPELRCAAVTRCANPSDCEAASGMLEVKLNLLPSSPSDSHSVIFNGERFAASLNADEDTLSFGLGHHKHRVTLLTGFGHVLLEHIEWHQSESGRSDTALVILDCGGM